MASVIKRCDHTVTQWARCKHSWVVRFYDPAGKQTEESFPHNNKTEAKDYAIKVESDKRLGVYIDRKQTKRTFADCWDEWLKFGEREVSTIEQYKSVYKNHFEATFANRLMGSLVASDKNKWKQEQKARGYKPYGIEGREVILKSFLKWAYESEIIPKNPFREIQVNGRKSSAYRPIPPDEIPNTSEVMAIHNAMFGHYKAMVWIMAGCGARPGEALAFSREHLTLKPGMYFIKNQVTNFGKNGKGNRGTQIKDEPKWSRIGRWVPVPPSVKDVLDTHTNTYEAWGDEGWFFESPLYVNRHPSRTHFTDRWDDAIESAGLAGRKFTPKSLRHYFASMAIAAGVPLWEVAQWLGHASTHVTETVYAHLVTGAEERITGAFEAALADAFRDQFRLIHGDAQAARLWTPGDGAPEHAA